MANEERPRRQFVKDIGIGVASLTALGTTATKTVDAESNTDGKTAEETDVEPQLVTNATTKWDPYSVQDGQTAMLSSTWNVTTPTLCDHYRFDILVDWNYVWKPEWVATNFSTGDIKKNWEYKQSAQPLDGAPAYHFKAVSWICAPLGTQLYVDSRVETCCEGKCTALTGSYQWPGDWSGAKLTVN